MSRSRSIEIYLKPGVEEDDQIYAVWEALRERGRPQDIFRRMLRAGLRAMVDTGELPRVALGELEVDILYPVPLATATQMMRHPKPPKPKKGTKSRQAPAGLPVKTKSEVACSKEETGGESIKENSADEMENSLPTSQVAEATSNTSDPAREKSETSAAPEQLAAETPRTRLRQIM
ncbi:hypothetical protein ACFOY8_14605 [Thalassospira xianhensis]|uniref:Uncharacterized protein n=1 Tax=Thalassospira xianhensis MCCC 1A02616 TaxID=1177929 RepID=A0A367UH38_9PROT|nr:hypothetical protein [Thalassospira xianhensis]RCK07617.1 hypothetical protein TH5_00635 [Thalassospira xianhensis MCCC 1A02616]